MELSGVSWSSVLCRSNIARGKNQPEFNCRAALTTMKCSWTRKISARPTSWPRHHHRRCLRPTIRRTPSAKGAHSSIWNTASALTLFTNGLLSSPKAITVYFSSIDFLLIFYVFTNVQRVETTRLRNGKRNAFIVFSSIEAFSFLLSSISNLFSFSRFASEFDYGERIAIWEKRERLKGKRNFCILVINVIKESSN